MTGHPRMSMRVMLAVLTASSDRDVASYYNLSHNLELVNGVESNLHDVVKSLAH